jgi:GLPGLI family protein
MKQIYIALVFLVTISFYGQKAFKATYVYEIKKEKLINNLKNKKKDITNPRRIEKGLEIFTKSRPSQAELYFDGTYSFYDVIEGLGFDNDRYSKIDPSYAFAGSNIKIYNDVNRDYLVEYQENAVFEDYSKYLTKYNCNAFEIKDKRKNIDGYNCIQAIAIDNSGKEIILWFSPEISTSFGPQKFCNLPGLIILIDAYAYTAKLKSLKKYNKTIEKYPKDVNFIDTTTLKKLRQQSFRKVFKN